MNTINICGKRGLGDIISGTSRTLKTLTEPTHIIFHYPPGFDYITTVQTIMEEYIPSLNVPVTYETDETWFTINERKASQKFGNENFNKTWFFTACTNDTYLPFKTQWKGDTKGPVCLVLNNENYNPQYPYPKKWFEPELNDKLKSLIDDKNYLHLGRPLSVRESIDRMARCRYVLGVDSGWAHCANAMRVPFKLVRNNYEKEFFKFHSRHPSMTIITADEVDRYLI